MRSIRLKRTTLFMCGLVGFLVGLGIARSSYYLGAAWLWLSLALLLATFRRKDLPALVCVVIFCVFFGWWRGSGYMQRLNAYAPLIEQEVTIKGQSNTDGTYAKNSQLSFDLKNLRVVEPYPVELVGKISVKGYGTTAVYRGDYLVVSGRLYPTRGSKQASISFAKISVIKRSTSLIEALRHKFDAGMFSALPEPLASFGLGLLIGQRNTLPDNVNDQLSSVGLTHIVAASGYNLTIIMSAAYILLKKRSKYQNTMLSLLLIGLFLLFAGSSASIVRAAIVSVLTLWAAYYGRSVRPLLLLLLAAVITAGWYPLYLWSDVGWYLSFLAFYGVLVIAPIVTKRIFAGKKARVLRDVIVETLSAQLMALPLIMYIFGEISLVALPANILVVPLVPLAMALSFVAALAGMIIPALAGWMAWPARILLTYMLDIVNIFAHIPHALASRALPLSQLLVLYAAVVFVTFVLWSKMKSKSDTITDIATSSRLSDKKG